MVLSSALGFYSPVCLEKPKWSPPREMWVAVWFSCQRSQFDLYHINESILSTVRKVIAPFSLLIHSSCVTVYFIEGGGMFCDGLRWRENSEKWPGVDWGRWQSGTTQWCHSRMVEGTGNVKPEEEKIREEKIVVFKHGQDCHMEESLWLFRVLSRGKTCDL